MIVTDLAHIDHQVQLMPSLRRAFDFLRGRDLLKLPDGRTEIDGDRVFALIQRYETERTEAPKFEYHRKYIDVQFIAAGEEIIGWTPAASLMVSEAYDPSRDICFGTAAPGSWTPVHLQMGQLMVLWPEDAHAPKGAVGASSRVMKIVIKVAV